ncbi:hypothetical protein Hthe01_03040 [Hydrogenophilus thermoluteolus]|uniref:YiiX/YebB-like N1pC/P60 family cysteine hydrolase n=1 Tax=Hydrogenophilus thermoluteolus TaxID=297 RepID=UPI0024A319D6|nr:YiiX/YebB-like N1pC/P60 family cysteine hydrolase [Hydrogenophilus thermoluteolus]GLW59955.1 hypothetical protein Hthe01_03040 [Hydrogenophilus thermoluteolus]
MLKRVGQWLARYLTRPIHFHTLTPPTPPERLLAVLQPGDVLLVEGNNRISTAIKYLTQSTWSHAALFVGSEPLQARGKPHDHCFIEADLVEGVRSVGITQYAGLNTRICRPVGLRPEDRENLIRFALDRLGNQYDLRNVVDLARYLLPTPPVPTNWRRRMLALGSGDPTRAICSTLLAQAFQAIGYPILPLITTEPIHSSECLGCQREIWQMRHHSLFVPRDFDLSPYLAVIKPTLESGFDYKKIPWQTPEPKILTTR